MPDASDDQTESVRFDAFVSHDESLRILHLSQRVRSVKPKINYSSMVKLNQKKYIKIFELDMVRIQLK